MRINIGVIGFLVIIMLGVGCQKKDIDINLIETACKNFKIYSPTYELKVDPCKGTSTAGLLRITFMFDGDKECIDKINVAPQFYKLDNKEISNVIYLPSILKEDTSVTISGNHISFNYYFQMASLPDASALNHILLKMYTENELGNESKKIELRINTQCSRVDPSTYSVTKTVNVTNRQINVTLWDDAAEDGDIVSIYLNGIWVMENYTLKKDGETFPFNINAGDNHIVLFAVNEGKSGPNTAAISINGNEKITISPDLLKGEAINIKF